MTPHGLFNGDHAAGSWLHRGFQYGDGVFRTCLIYRGQVIDLEGQLKRLSSDAKRLRLRAPVAALAREARALAKRRAIAVLKIFLLRAGGERGYRVHSSASDRLLLLYPAPRYPAAHWARGVATARSDFRLAAQPALAGVKHLNRLEQVIAASASPRSAVEAIVADEAGRPVSGTRTNLFWVRRGRLFTPSLERCGVAGRMRERVLALAARAPNLKTSVVDAPWSELLRADEVFLTNSLVGIWPVRALGRRRFAAPGPVTRFLMEQLAHPRLAPA